MVRSCLRGGGRVGFVDEDDRAAALEAQLDAGPVPTARRTLTDGRQFDIVKVFWSPSDLAARVDQLGWKANIRPVGDNHLYRTAEPR